MPRAGAGAHVTPLVALHDHPPLAAYAQSARSTLDLRRGTTRFRAALAPGVRPARDVTTARLGADARYVRIAAFERGTAAKLAALLLERDAPPVLVLDLRNNNGGALQAALRDQVRENAELQAALRGAQAAQLAGGRAWERPSTGACVGEVVQLRVGREQRSRVE